MPIEIVHGAGGGDLAQGAVTNPLANALSIARGIRAFKVQEEKSRRADARLDLERQNIRSIMQSRRAADELTRERTATEQQLRPSERRRSEAGARTQEALAPGGAVGELNWRRWSSFGGDQTIREQFMAATPDVQADMVEAQRQQASLASRRQALMGRLERMYGMGDLGQPAGMEGEQGAEAGQVEAGPAEMRAEFLGQQIEQGFAAGDFTQVEGALDEIEREKVRQASAREKRALKAEAWNGEIGGVASDDLQADAALAVSKFIDGDLEETDARAMIDRAAWLDDHGLDQMQQTFQDPESFMAALEIRNALKSDRDATTFTAGWAEREWRKLMQEGREATEGGDAGSGFTERRVGGLQQDIPPEAIGDGGILASDNQTALAFIADAIDQQMPPTKGSGRVTNDDKRAAIFLQLLRNQAEGSLGWGGIEKEAVGEMLMRAGIDANKKSVQRAYSEVFGE